MTNHVAVFHVAPCVCVRARRRKSKCVMVRHVSWPKGARRPCLAAWASRRLARGDRAGGAGAEYIVWRDGATGSGGRHGGDRESKQVTESETCFARRRSRRGGRPPLAQGAKSGPLKPEGLTPMTTRTNIASPVGVRTKVVQLGGEIL